MSGQLCAQGTKLLLRRLRLRRSGCVGAGWPATAHAAHHLRIFLLLIGRKNGIDLRGGVRANLLHLRHAIFLRKRCVGTQLLRLAGFALENRLDLFLLISSEFECLSHTLESLIDGRRLASRTPLSTWRLSGSGHAPDQQQGKYGGEKRLFHRPKLLETRCRNAAARSTVAAVMGALDVNMVIQSLPST